MGAVLSLFVLVPFIAEGFRQPETLSVSVQAAVITYLAGGLIGGVLVGVLLPLVRTGVGSAVLGFFALLPVGVAGVAQLSDAWPWTIVEVVSTFIFALAIGAPTGMIYRSIFYSGTDAT